MNEPRRSDESLLPPLLRSHIFDRAGGAEWVRKLAPSRSFRPWRLFVACAAGVVSFAFVLARVEYEQVRAADGSFDPESLVCAANAGCEVAFVVDPAGRRTDKRPGTETASQADPAAFEFIRVLREDRAASILIVDWPGGTLPTGRVTVRWVKRKPLLRWISPQMTDGIPQ